jgi:hypothetical protein
MSALQRLRKRLIPFFRSLFSNASFQARGQADPCLFQRRNGVFARHGTLPPPNSTHAPPRVVAGL